MFTRGRRGEEGDLLNSSGVEADADLGAAPVHLLGLLGPRAFDCLGVVASSSALWASDAVRSSSRGPIAPSRRPGRRPCTRVEINQCVACIERRGTGIATPSTDIMKMAGGRRDESARTRCKILISTHDDYQALHEREGYYEGIHRPK